MRNSIIDFTAGGIFAAIFGTTSSIIRQAMSRVKGGFCSYAPRFNNYWRDRYYELSREFTGYDSVVAFCEGSVAVEAFWRVARAYTGKPGIWGGLVDPDDVGKDKPVSDAMHGWTLGSMIAAGKMNWPELHYYPELGESRFGSDYGRTGCMIMEPYHAPSGQFHKIDPTINRISARVREFENILFCVDEIQGGFGRTGKLFAFDHYGKSLPRPTFVTIGKLAGGGMPLSALLGPKEIMESDTIKEFGHLSSTHSGHPVMCSVGVAVIEEIQKQGLILQAEQKGEILHKLLSELPIQTHGKGLMAGLVLQDNIEVKEIVKRCEELGLIVCDTGRKWVKIAPALTIKENEIIKGCKTLQQVVEEVVGARKDEPEAHGNIGEGSGPGSEVLQTPGVQPSGESGNTKGPENEGSEGKPD